MKSIEVEKANSPEVYHLRYFRIVFTTAKFVIKVEKSDRKMRSFPLAELCSAEATDTFVAGESSAICIQDDETALKVPLLTRDAILAKYNLDETVKRNMWSHTISIAFLNSSFTISYPTETERNTWLRLFRSYINMNRNNINVTSINPYTLEKKRRLQNLEDEENIEIHPSQVPKPRRRKSKSKSISKLPF